MYRQAFIVLLLSWLFLPATTSAQQPDCEKLPSHNQQGECFADQLKHAEAEMQRTYERALTSHSGPLSPQEKKELAALPRADRQLELMWRSRMLRRLQESQRLWMAYRDSTCGAYAATYEEGNITASVVPICKR